MLGDLPGQPLNVYLKSACGGALRAPPPEAFAVSSRGGGFGHGWSGGGEASSRPSGALAASRPGSKLKFVLRKNRAVNFKFKVKVKIFEAKLQTTITQK